MPPRADNDRARGALLGTLIGDALGRPFEGASSREAERARLLDAIAQRVAAPRAWGHSDDGEMMLNVADAIRERGAIDEDELLACLARGHEPARGYGKGMLAAFRVWAEGGGWESASRALWEEGSRGNGAAVRVAPVAVWMSSAAEVDVAVAARRTAAATHGHEEAAGVAAVITVAVHRALRAEQRAGVLAGLDEHAPPAIGERVRAATGLCDEPPARAVDALGTGVLAIESGPAALWAFGGAASFEDAIVRAVGLGGDTDSIGAMAGAIAGGYVGAASIPECWVAALERDAVARVERFAAWLSDR